MNDEPKPMPALFMTAGGETMPAALQSLAEDFAARADMMLLTEASGASGANLVILAYGAGVNTAIDQMTGDEALSHVALLHPKLAAPLKQADLDKTRILITAGATDPRTPASAIGEFADALDAAGARTEVHWNRGGGEITGEELARVTEWLSNARAALADPRQLPITDDLTGEKGRYLITAPGGVFAEMSYSRVNDELIIIDHTDVPQAFSGTGTGRRLLDHAIAEARATGTKIIPLCPFAAAQFKKHPEWSDVLETKVRVKPKRG